MPAPRRLAVLLTLSAGGDGPRHRHRGHARAAAPVRPAGDQPGRLREHHAGQPESEWDITGAGSPRSRASPPTSASTRARRSASRSTPTASTYRLDIYRMGYYGGAGARKVATVNPTVLQQPAELPHRRRHRPGRLRQLAADAPRGPCRPTPSPASTSPSWCAPTARPAPATSSSSCATTTAARTCSSRPPTRPGRPTTRYGGNSLYTGAPAGRAYKVSYNRPFTTRGNAPEDCVFNAEYPMVRFLEAQRLRRQLHHRRRHRPPRRRAARAQDVPVRRPRRVLVRRRSAPTSRRPATPASNLAFFSGNEVFWKTRWETSIDGSGHPAPHPGLATRRPTPTPRSTRSPTLDRHLARPAVQPAGRRRPARERADRARSSRSTAAPIDMVVGQADGQLRFWRNTRVATPRPPAQTTTLGTDILGYEWDEDLDNGFRPAGPDPPVRRPTGNGRACSQDYGSTYAPGTATHTMTLYRAASGALVFGAGTDPVVLGPRRQPRPRLGAPPTPRLQQATVNLLRRHGRRSRPRSSPASPPPRRRPTRPPPTSTITSPAAGATLAAGQPGHDHRHRHRQRRRTGRRRRGLHRRRRHLATGPPGASIVDLHVHAAPQRRSLRSASPGHRRQRRTSRPPSPRASPSASRRRPPARARSGPAPPTPAGTDPDTQLGRAGREVPRRDQTGSITGIRFYKGAGNTGTHVGSLWTSTGTRLGHGRPSPTRRASGWQQAIVRHPGPGHRQHHLRRLLLRARRPLRRQLELLRRRRDHPRTADRAARTAPTAATASTATPRPPARSRPAPTTARTTGSTSSSRRASRHDAKPTRDRPHAGRRGDRRRGRHRRHRDLQRGRSAVHPSP